MKIKHSIIGLSVFSLIALSSCFDNDYDLGDIDTTVKVRANLTVPIQLDNITLDQVLDIDDDSEIVKTKIADENGGDSVYIYAVKKMGDFGSDPIEIDQFTTTEPVIEPAHSTLDLTIIKDAVDKLPEGFQEKTKNGLTAYYSIASDSVAFETSAEGLDEALKHIEYIGVDASFGITLTITDEYGNPLERMDSIYLEDVRIKLPNALIATAQGGIRDEKNDSANVLYFERLGFDEKGKVEIDLSIDSIYAEANGMAIDYDNHTFDYSDHIQILEGYANIYKLGLDLFPEHVAFTFAPHLSAIKVTSFTGTIEYKVADFNIAPVDLSGLPDALTKSGTKLWLHNPQIYLSANNPVWEYNAFFQTDFSFTSIRDGKEATYRTTLSTKRKDGRKQTKDNNFILSPSDVDPTPDAELEKEFPDWRPIPFDDLRNMLAGDDNQPLDGIPTTIEIHASDPMLPPQRIEDFQMGVTLEAVHGSYAFFAPLQLSAQSKIRYEDIIDGWSDDDLDNVTIQKVHLSFNATTDIPFDIELDVVPIDKNGKDIDCECNTVLLSANADNQLVEFIIEGTINRFDGIRLEARVQNVDDNTILAPTMAISVKNSKVTVDGYYEAEL